MPTPILRPEYQVPLITDVRGALSEKSNGHFLVQLGTGGGKTFIFSYIAANANSKGNKVFILSDRTELLTQAYGSVGQFGITAALVHPSVKHPSYEAMTTIGMSQTLKRRLDKPEWIKLIQSQDIFILDEAHKNEFNYLFTSGLLDNKTVLGFTATPIRAGKMRQLGMDYDKIIQGVTIPEMVNMGYLMPERYFSVDNLDVSNVPFNPMTGDLKSSALYAMMNNREKYTGVVDNYRRIADGTKAMTFCVNIQHAVKTAAEFEKSGIPSLFVVSATNKPKKPDTWKNEGERLKYEDKLEAYMTLKQYDHLTGERNDVIKAFKKSKQMNLVNVDMLTTGFDCPDLVTGIINRSTISQVLYSQMVGRFSRPSKDTGKIHFNIIDMGNHLQREAMPLKGYMDRMEFGLWHEPKKGGGVMPTKLCDPTKIDFRGKRGCGRLIGVSMKMCTCGYTFPTKKQEKEVELKEIIYANAPDEKVLVSTMNYKQLKAFTELKKYQPTWLARELFRRGGKNELRKGMKECGYGNGYIYRLIKLSEKYNW